MGSDAVTSWDPDASEFINGLAGVANTVYAVEVHSPGWHPGVYLCRLEAGGATSTHKILVVGR